MKKRELLADEEIPITFLTDPYLFENVTKWFNYLYPGDEKMQEKEINLFFDSLYNLARNQFDTELCLDIFNAYAKVKECYLPCNSIKELGCNTLLEVLKEEDTSRIIRGAAEHLLTIIKVFDREEVKGDLFLSKYYSLCNEITYWETKAITAEKHTFPHGWDFVKKVRKTEEKRAKLAADLMTPHNAVKYLEKCENKERLDAKITHLVQDNFRFVIIRGSILSFNVRDETRQSQPYREDMVEWCLRLLSYYDFLPDGDFHIVHPFQLLKIKEGTLENSYSGGFVYHFTNATPKKLEDEIRDDLKQVGMPEEDLIDRFPDVPTTSTSKITTEVIIVSLGDRLMKVTKVPKQGIVKSLEALFNHYNVNPNLIIVPKLKLHKIKSPAQLETKFRKILKTATIMEIFALYGIIMGDDQENPDYTTDPFPEPLYMPIKVEELEF